MKKIEDLKIFASLYLIQIVLIITKGIPVGPSFLSSFNLDCGEFLLKIYIFNIILVCIMFLVSIDITFKNFKIYKLLLFIIFLMIIIRFSPFGTIKGCVVYESDALTLFKLLTLLK